MFPTDPAEIHVPDSEPTFSETDIKLKWEKLRNQPNYDGDTEGSTNDLFQTNVCEHFHLYSFNSAIKNGACIFDSQNKLPPRGPNLRLLNKTWL